MKLSYPKNRIRALLLEDVDPVGAQLLREEGYQVETLSGSLDQNELAERVADINILGIRSKTRVTPQVLENAKRLIGIGAFCVGTNEVDLLNCTQRGIAVFNAPFSNTRAVVELALGAIISLARRVPERSARLHAGVWEKSTSGSFEIRGKKLGLVGYGNIGAQLSVLAEAVGMHVLYFDVAEKLQLGNAAKCRSLHELLQQADVVSIHVDGRAENANLIGAAEFAAMKPGAVFLNLSRGHVVDLSALAQALRSGHISGAALDVFPVEPKNNQEPFESELRGMPNVILTPHVGGSTAEAQRNIAQFVPERIIAYMNTGNTQQCVNLPNLQLPVQQAHRLIHLHANVPGVLASINNLLAAHRVNILGQYLKTNEQVGYVITDIDKEYNPDVVGELRKVEHTIKFRVLY